LRNVPTESIELEAPVFVKRYMLADTAAAGEYRGGAGVVFEFRCLAADAIVTARGMDRFKLRPYGRNGAEPGTLGDTVINPDSAYPRRIGKIDILKLEAGDVVRIIAPGGGGYGDPMARESDAVKRDVANGFVTDAQAREVYGFDGDGTRTTPANAVAAPDFVFGAERLAYEAALPPALQDMLAMLLQGHATSVRQYLRGRIYGEVLERSNLATLTDEALETALRDLITATLTSPLQQMLAAE
jgi:N-methylhydantoinase B